MNLKKLTSWIEIKYWTSRWFQRHGQEVLFKLMPNWLVQQAMIKASRHVLPHEVVPDVKFMTIFERTYKEESRHG
jgi:hypothetical protein